MLVYMGDAQEIIYNTFSILVQWTMKYTHKHIVKSIFRVGKLLG